MKSFLICFFITGLVCCQSSVESITYRKADSIAGLFKPKCIENLPVLVHGLTSNLDTDLEKFRAIFFWVGNNIANDYQAYRKTASKQKKMGVNEKEYREWNQSYLPKVYKRLVKKHKTACTGYAYLIKQMANLAGLECKIIDGFAKTASTNLTLESNPNHSWNAIKLDGKWFLCDATWSAGKVNFYEDVPKFTFDFSEGYFLSSPELFALNHYPLDPKWLLLEDTFSFEDFLNGPIVYKGAFEQQIKPQSPLMEIEKIIGTPIILDFSSQRKIDKKNIELFIVQSSSANRITPEIKIMENGFQLKHTFIRKGLYDVHVMVDDQVIATFVAEFSKNSFYP